MKIKILEKMEKCELNYIMFENCIFLKLSLRSLI